jgi:hypothetical protein
LASTLSSFLEEDESCFFKLPIFLVGMELLEATRTEERRGAFCSRIEDLVLLEIREMVATLALGGL